jgi:hypothetical protein
VVRQLTTTVVKDTHCTVLEILRVNWYSLPRENLNSISQSCPVRGSGLQVLIYQLINGPLVRPLQHQRAHPTKEDWAKTPWGDPPEAV